MKKSIQSKTLSMVALVLAAPLIVLGSHASAIGEGQIERGDIYYSKNLTTGGSFGDPTAADKCQSLQYKVRMHNPGADTVTNVRISVNLPAGASTSNVSTATITADNAFPATISDTATVNISSAQKISYKSGSTQLLNSQNAVIGSLPDGITSGGVTIGSVGVSINEVRYVQFKADIDCPTPETPAYSCDAFNITADINRTVKISTFSTTATNGAVFKNASVNWGDNSIGLTAANIVGQTHQYSADGTYTITATAHFTVDGKDVSAGGPNCVKQVTFTTGQPPKVTPPATPPTTLVNTGAGSVAAIFAAATAAGAVAYRTVLARRLTRQ
ncbi:MAG: hypothetical protein AAB436_02185 [Patescibacteria group bacterium]